MTTFGGQTIPPLFGGVIETPIFLRDVGAVVWDFSLSQGPSAANLPTRQAGDILCVWLAAIANDPGVPVFANAPQWNGVETSGSFGYRLYSSTASNTAADAVSTPAGGIGTGWPRGIIMASFKNNSGATFSSDGTETLLAGFNSNTIFVIASGATAPGAAQWLRLSTARAGDQSPTDTAPSFTRAFENPYFDVFMEFQYDPTVDNAMFMSCGYQYLTGAAQVVPGDQLTAGLTDIYNTLAKCQRIVFT
jgi:hypothetical protein